MTKLAAVLVGAALGIASCTPAGDNSSKGPTGQLSTTATPAQTTPTSRMPSRGDAITEWKARAGDHFRQSAAALDQVSKASASEDEAGLRAGCTRLHDTNSIGLQADLPTPDPTLTAELQRMIDDMNTATHACLRFALARNPLDADTYQEYLARAIAHLQRAKVLLNAAER